MIELIKLIYEVFKYPYEVQLLEFFSVWGIVIQTLITIFISGITIWLMVKYGENQKMIGELKLQSKSINDQLDLMIELNPPCLVYQSQYVTYYIDEFKFKGVFVNVGRDLYNLQVKNNQGGSISILNQTRNDLIPRNSAIEISFRFDSPHTSKISPKMILEFSDKELNLYNQTAVLNSSCKVLLSGTYKLYHETT